MEKPGFPIHALPPGTPLQQETYVIDGFLGQGGFGITYRAHDPHLDRHVAIKELFLRQKCNRAWIQPPLSRVVAQPSEETAQGLPLDFTVVPTDGWTTADLEKARSRFLEEGRKLYGLRHPGVVPVYSLFAEHGTAYLVMGYVEGETLRQYVHRLGGRLPVEEALVLTQAAGAALAAVHLSGLVHQDITPQNVMRHQDGRVVLIDFGSARAATEMGETHTVMHTAGYSALEQYSRRGVLGAHTDVYGLAATLYYLLTGDVPLSPVERLAGGELAAPKVLRSEVPDEVSTAILAGLALHGKDRPPAMSAFLETLVLRRRSSASRPVFLNSKRPVVVLAPVIHPTEPAPPPQKVLEAGVVRVNSKDGAKMVWVPPGEFQMGTQSPEIHALWAHFGWPNDWQQHATDESPLHRVRLAKGFWLYRTPVTNAQYRRFVTETGHRVPGYTQDVRGIWKRKATIRLWDLPEFNGAEYPVVGVSWEDAVAYCEWAHARLPTEAEWEYAARGGDTGLEGQARRVFVWGNELPQSRRLVANVADVRVRQSPYYQQGWETFPNYDDGYVHTSPVGNFQVNGYGLYDMAGNVWEWCMDWYGKDYYNRSPLINPPGPLSGDMRVLRGGSWISNPDFLRVAFRRGDTPDVRSLHSGFRPVQSG